MSEWPPNRQSPTSPAGSPDPEDSPDRNEVTPPPPPRWSTDATRASGTEPVEMVPPPPPSPVSRPAGPSFPSAAVPPPPGPPIADAPGPTVTAQAPVVPAHVPLGGGDRPTAPPQAWPQPAVEPPPRKRRWARAAALGVGAIALVGGGVTAGVLLSDDDTEPAATAQVPISAPEDTSVDTPTQVLPTPIPEEPGPVPADVEEPSAAVAAALSPSVVRIDTGGGTGSGIIYDESGLIVTNAHVVGAAENVSVQLSDGTRVSGIVVGSDPAVDVAVVQLEEGIVLDVAVFAPNSTVEVGQLAVAIGSPFGLEQSVTAGIISAVNRAVESQNVATGAPTVVEMVQTDAPINPGNSGGALADRQGRVVGMNTSIRTDGTTQGNLGVGFAIPSDTVLLVAGRIVAGEPLDSGFLGISGGPATSGRAGALVTEVVADSPAQEGGLEVGDLIVSLDGEPVLGMAELAAKVRISSPGTTVTLEAIRDGQPVSIDVTLGELGR